MGPADDEDHHRRTGAGPGRPWSGKRLTAVIVGVALVIAAAGTALAIATGDERPEPTVPAGTASGPGTPLPDGLAVIAGSVLLGPVVVEEVGADGQPTAWSAVVMVESDDPLAVWSDYVAQLVHRSGDSGPDADTEPGCMSPAPDVGELCSLAVGGIRAELVSVPGDVTGRFLLTLERSPMVDDTEPDDVTTWPGGDPPDPEPARDRPDVGEPLAPRTVVSDGDNERYVLVEGSELVAQPGPGSITGGFTVLLHVTSGADLDEVTGAYVEQATQFEGEEADPPEVVEYDGTTFRTYLPPGGAGGYTGVVTAVDGPAGADYIVFDLFND